MKTKIIQKKYVSLIGADVCREGALMLLVFCIFLVFGIWYSALFLCNPNEHYRPIHQYLV